MITGEVGTLYETESVTQAAKEVCDAATVLSRDFFAVMVHAAEPYNKVCRLF